MENPPWLSSLQALWQGEGAAAYRLTLTVFATVFLAELGDKTQLATLLFAANGEVNKWLVFVGSALALILTSAIGTFAGALISQYISEKYLHYAAGVGFVLVGLWTLLKA